MANWAYFIGGAAVGTLLGMLIAAMCVVAGRADERMERMGRPWEYTNRAWWDSDAVDARMLDALAEEQKAGEG